MTDPSGTAVPLPSQYRTRFNVVEEEVRVGDARFTLARPADAEALISEEDFNRDERLPYWADLWPSAYALGEMVLETRGQWRHGQGVELGCGIGLVACCAVRAKLELTITDYYEDALAFAMANVRANTGRDATARHLDWRALPGDVGRFDFVLAADVLYELSYGPLVARVTNQLLRPGGKGWIADPGRTGAGAFVAEARALGVHVVSHSRRVRVKDREHDITLYELTAPAP